MTSRSDITRELLVFGMQRVGQTPRQVTEAWAQAAHYANIHLLAAVKKDGKGRNYIELGGSDAPLGADILKKAGFWAETDPKEAERMIGDWLDDCRWANR